MREDFRVTSGNDLRCKGWRQEGLLRLLENVLAVGEDPDNLIVYAALGRAARDWPSHDAIVRALKTMDEGETLIVQSGKPIGIVRTHPGAPLVIMANCNMVGQWAKAETFYALQDKGLICWGGLTAGDWQYIGSQGVIQGTYEIFMRIAERHFGGDLRGRFVLTAGLGGMGGAQPLAGRMAGAAILAVDVDPERIAKRLAVGYLERRAGTLDEALAMIRAATAAGTPLSVGLQGNAAEIYPDILARGIVPDVVTDQTSAHDLVNGYLPVGWTVAQWEAAAADPGQHARLTKAAAQGCAQHVQAMLDFQAMGIPTVDYGNNIRQVAFDEGVKNAFDFPGFVPAYIRPLFCEGKGPFRWVALSGDPEDIYKTDAKIKELFPENKHTHRWLDMARERIAFQGLPSRICWLGLGERHKAALAFNEMVKNGELKAPIVIGRDHLDCGSVASPNRETESMKDGTDAVSDWPLLNALLNTAGGATWVSLHHGGGVGMGYSQHAGVVIVADGTDEAAKRLGRVLWNDPATGVMRHADAGYEIAVEASKRHGLNLPMVK